MAAIDFPNAPAVGDRFAAAGHAWVWDGTVWGAATDGSGTIGVSTYRALNTTGVIALAAVDTVFATIVLPAQPAGAWIDVDWFAYVNTQVATNCVYTFVTVNGVKVTETALHPQAVSLASTKGRRPGIPLPAGVAVTISAVGRKADATGTALAYPTDSGLDVVLYQPLTMSLTDGTPVAGRLVSLTTHTSTVMAQAATGAWTVITGVTTPALTLKAGQRVMVDAMVDLTATAAGGAYVYAYVNGGALTPGVLVTGWPLNFQAPVQVTVDYTVPADGNYTFDIRLLSAGGTLKANNGAGGGGSRMRVAVYSAP
jgi:hypothetical protein